MNLIKTTGGTVLNLAHAFELQYNENDLRLTIWWAFPMAGSIGNLIAEQYDDERLTYHSVDKSEWLRFLEKNR